MSFTPRFVDLVRNYTTTTGPDDFALGPAVNGFTSFSAAMQAGESFYYSAIGVDKPAEREVGRGTFQADGTISRAPIGGTATHFTTGNKTVSLIAAAEWFNDIQAGLQSGGGSGPAIAASRQLLSSSAMRGPTLLTEAGREGLFVFDPSNLGARVAADPQQAIHIAPAADPTGASGGWVRKFSGSLDARWFGLSTSETGMANKTALDAAIAHHLSSGIPLEIPAGTYDHTGALTIEGNYCNVYGASWGKTILRPTSASEGIILKSRYGRLARIGLDGSVAGTYGIVARGCAETTIEDCDARNFDNDGLLIDLGYGGGSAGNNNQLKIRGGSYNLNGGCGVKMIHGLDNNDVQFLGVNASGNTSHGFLLRGHGGYVDPACIAEGNGGYGIQIAEDADVVDVTGWEINQPYIEGNGLGGIRGSDASQNNLIRLKNISGTQGYSGHAGSANTVSSVVGGGLLRFGSNDGVVFVQASGSASAGTAYLTAAHATSGNADLTLGGAGTGTVVALGQTAHAAGTGFLTAHLRVEPNNSTVGNNATLALQHGVNGATGGGVYLQSELAPSGFGNFVLRVRGAGSMTERFRINNDGASTLTGTLNVTSTLAASNLSGTNTGDQFTNIEQATFVGRAAGAGAGAASALTAAQAKTLLAVAPADLTFAATAKLLGRATAAGGPGEEVGLGPGLGFNGSNIQVQFAATAKLLGRTTAGAGASEEIGVTNGITLVGGNLGLGAITPGSVAATGAVKSSGAGGIGYATGGGGAVTQATSKSSGVTLNKASGQITMHNAALAAAAIVEFMVTNSEVVATDTVNLNWGSGAAASTAYRYWVSGVAAGSFKICVENRSGGSLSEALVLNFAVLKAVSA
jgi:hypothetical protein